ncbi:MAG: NADPH-dependent FMN reductase [Saprospiraceae bacterium]
MKLLTISGSTRSESANTKLLKVLPSLFPKHSFQHYPQINQLPLFQADADKYPWHATIIAWRAAIAEADAVIISIPEYIYNMPALLKNALEWLTSSGELVQKRVLAITFTPYKPRGAKAMQSLLWSLQALDANVVVSLPLYQNEIDFDTTGNFIENEAVEMMKEAIHILIN